MKLSALVSKIAGFVGARLLGAAVGFLSQLVLARLLPIEDVGVVLLGMSAAAFISLGANGGYALLATTELPKLETRRQTKTAAAFNRVAMMDGILAYCILCAIGWLAAVAYGLTDGQKTALLLGAICAPASMTMRYNASIGMAARYFKTAYMPDLLFRPAALLIGLLAAGLAGWLQSAQAALVIFVAVTYLTSFGQAWALKGNRLSFSHLGWPRIFFARRIRSRAIALTLVSATMLAFADIVIMVSGFILPERDVAIAGVAMRVAAIAGFMLQAGQMLVMTDFTQALVSRNESAVEAILKRVNGLTVAIVLACLAGVTVFGKFALGLFGPDYQQGALLLVLFMIGQSVRALGGMNQQILSINGYQLRTAGSCVAALLVFVGLAFVFCKNYGSTGLGYAVIASELVWLIALAVQAHALCGRRGDLLWVLQKR
jgi:O-antigen/teichoic acid export membrane protein